MTSFRKTEEQAHHLTIKKSAHGESRRAAKINKIKRINSIATEKKYISCIKIFFDWCVENKYSTSEISSEAAEKFLKFKSNVCTQKTLDGYRQAINMVFDLNINYVFSSVPTILQPRAYNNAQISFLIENCGPALVLSIELATACGLRAVELDTIAKLKDYAESQRDWLPERFFGLYGCEYVVIGKGGLKRKIIVPIALSQKLENFRLNNIVIKTQREIHYKKYYSIVGGHSFSQQFSRLSFELFSWSTGAHGLRHSYAQARIIFLQKNGFTYDYSLKITSQELGHFSTTNTLTYLR